MSDYEAYVAAVRAGEARRSRSDGLMARAARATLAESGRRGVLVGAESRAEVLRARAERLREQAEREEAEAEFWSSLPAEPVGLKDGTALVLFDKTFRSTPTTVYRYAAVRTEAGWFMTGPATELGAKTWSQVLEVIYDRAASVESWVTTEMVAL